MRDPYTVLGVPRNADDKAIKSAYRRLAKAFHPDQNQEDPTAQAKFAEASGAYDLLTDKDKRAQFDRGEIDGNGQPNYAGFNPGAARARQGAGPGANFSAEDILKEFMSGLGGQQRRPRGSQPGGAQPGGAQPGGAQWDPFTGSMGGGAGRASAKGDDLAVVATASLEDANSAASVQVRMPSGKVLAVKLPEKVEDGQQIRLKGQGNASPMGGDPGDALVTVRFERHKLFRRDGLDLRVDVPIALYEAVLGAKVRVPTLDGSVELNLPAGVDTVKSLRLKGKGLYGQGDIFVNLKIKLPDSGDADLESLMKFWRDSKPYKVRD